MLAPPPTGNPVTAPDYVILEFSGGSRISHTGAGGALTSDFCGKTYYFARFWQHKNERNWTEGRASLATPLTWIRQWKLPQVNIVNGMKNDQ